MSAQLILLRVGPDCTHLHHLPFWDTCGTSTSAETPLLQLLRGWFSWACSPPRACCLGRPCRPCMGRVGLTALAVARTRACRWSALGHSVCAVWRFLAGRLPRRARCCFGVSGFPGGPTVRGEPGSVLPRRVGHDCCPACGPGPAPCWRSPSLSRLWVRGGPAVLALALWPAPCGAAMLAARNSLSPCRWLAS